MNAMMRVDGVVTFWSPAAWTSRDALLSGWTALGYEKFVPEARELLACLKDALAQIYQKHLVRPLEKRDGFAVYLEKCGKDENSYPRVVTAKLDSQGRIYYPMDSLTYEQQEAIEQAYSRQQGLLKPAQLTSALVALLDSLCSTRLKPTGGIYWLRQERLAEWQAAVSIVEAAGCEKSSTTVYLIRHNLDADAMRAVKDALIREIETETARISKDIDTLDLGDRALANRQAEAEALLAKVQEYEQILGESLPTLQVLCQQTTDAACAAALLDSAAAVA